ncbi:PP2C family protein-serine/threonine phosphatase [Oerskovia enterophila]|uniref:Phosphoserine phosphatase RsbP n=1 Tax=Oerskovia enterophila TaxID=43678 RepID=A0ABX2Y2G2_9CELL|nr:SpoIIE family protein phosphatase [Oerskovia enterophila]OCI30704.1 phosphoserine phosphatase RsbP [Oerskovia enterophila]
MSSDWFDLATQGTESGELARSIDWSATSIGAPDTWPKTLRAAVRLCFSTRFPIFIAWGPELLMIYNDGYRPMLGEDKHPAAMGAPASAVWAEIWPEIEPLFDSVLATGVPTWSKDQPLIMNRSGFDEETAFTFSYSPLRDEEGTICGVMDVATETTDHVVDARRLQTLGTLTAALQRLQGDVDELAAATVAVLGRSQDVTRADLYLDTSAGLVPFASTHERHDESVPPHVLREVADRRRLDHVGNALVAPLAATRDRVAAGVIVLEGNPHRPDDDAQRSFLQLVASAVGTALSSTLAQIRQVDELRTVANALQDAMLPDDPTAPGWHTRYRPADDSLLIGGDWYDVVDLSDGRFGLVVGDCVGKGLRAAAVMGQLRSASRALLLENLGPAATLEGLDRFARTLPGAELATVLCAIVDENARTITYSAAGHLPPLVVNKAETCWLNDGRGTPLALTSLPRQEATAALDSGDAVILYTDGLVERRGEHLSEGLRRLADVALAIREERPAADLPDELLAELLSGGARDDVALLLYEVP